MKKKVIFILLSFILMFNLTGCSKDNNSSSKETKYFRLNIDGDKEFISEDDKDANNAAALMEKYTKTYVDRDYRNDEYKKEMDYYTSEAKEQKNNVKYLDIIGGQLKQYQLVREIGGYSLEKVEFYKIAGAESAEVTCTYIIIIKNATEEYLKLTEYEINKPVKVRAKIVLKKENGNWLVSEAISRDIVKE